jgi:hypothetical protein
MGLRCLGDQASMTSPGGVASPMVALILQPRTGPLVSVNDIFL